MVSVGFPLMSPAMPLSPPASYTMSSIEYRYTAPVATPYAFNASLAPTAKMLPSADTDTEDPKRARYMPLSIDSDMEYGDDKESREDDNTVVSFTATVGFALAVGPIDDDDNAGDDVVVGDVDEVGPMLPAGITLLEGGFDEELEGGLDNVGPTVPAGMALPEGGFEAPLEGGVVSVGPKLPAGMKLPDGGFERPLEGGFVNVGPTLAVAGTTLPPEGGMVDVGPTMPPSPPVEGALPDGEGDIDIAGP